MKRTALLVVLCLSVSISGCSIIPGERSDTESAQVAPGVTESGIEDSDAMIRAHGDYLENHSFTVRRTETVTTENGTVIEERRTRTAVAEGFSAYRFELNHSRGNESLLDVTYYFDGERGWQASWTDNGREVESFSAENRLSEFVTRSTQTDRLRPILESFTTTVSGSTELNGKTLYYVRSTDFHNRYGFLGPRQPVAELQYAEFSASVDSERFVHEYRLLQRGPGNATGETLTVERRVRYTDVGETTVERPEWAEE
ncbi:hypothetical protein GJ631_11655 [Natronomonas sp. CBA1123]|uniref:hypothetical protein n=1 Tax=Natronomonas sp. CBA1123 TaxID=2668070 RepID=UPI0012EA0A99|nr:hypothetical protein [Natronomonas sp. CBA1123]MUV87201.1 hypothetical protein [Natronomonas sp. CBA1123]